MDTRICYCALGLWAGATALPAGAGEPNYRCVFLMDQGDEDFSIPSSINTKGAVVGLGTANEFGPRAALWKGAQVFDLGSLVPDDFAGSYAFGINDKGVVVGESSNAQLDRRPVTWQNGVIAELPVPPGDHAQGTARAINRRGDVVGSASLPDAGYVVHAMLWRDGQRFDLGALGGEKGQLLKRSEAVAINDHGVAVGHSDVDRHGNWHAVLWNRQRKIHDLGTLPGGAHSNATGINSSRIVVGKSNYAGGEGYQFRAVAWQGDSLLDLGTLPGHDDSQALAINDANVIVGDSSVGVETGRAVVWFGLDHAPVDLNNLLAKGGCRNDSGLSYPLVTARAINIAGEIAAIGEVIGWDGGPRLAAFRLVPTLGDEALTPAATGTAAPRR